MGSFAQLYNVHFEVSARDDFTVLLGNSDKLSHILHATNRLADLTSHCNEGLTAVGKLLPMFVEVRIFAVAGPCRWQLHQICDFILEHLHDRAID